eukprot:gb/GFBE01008320.1/.p1 GENE.gb/GFBE01008320.1/~~gb/GFBE01008320.1/.p1  ORF type:complete len:187 (+),score=17.10 gb/GFBE01008320.1/:1-561(+)
MNFTSCPVKNPHTNPSHFGPGSERGKPFYICGQECEKVNVPKGSARLPLSLSGTAKWQCAPNQRHKERTLRVFGDPPSHRSCVVSHNKDGLVMDSTSHYTKVGSKHMCDPRPDHSHALHRSMTLPDMHPWDTRRAILRDPTPWHFNAAFSTTNDGYGKFYSSHLLTEPSVMKRSNFDWRTTKLKLK